jgi:hypothetical protein
MITQEKVVEANQGLDKRRAFMQLPLDERRRRLAAQAEGMIEHYEQESEKMERLRWQGGDIVEPD